MSQDLTSVHTPTRNFLTESGPYLAMEGLFFRVQSVRKFGSAVCSISKFWYNYFTCKEQTLCMFFTCKEWISHTFYAKSECKDVSYPIILGSIPAFSRMTSLKLKPKPTVDIECVLSWHVRNVHKVCSSHIMYTTPNWNRIRYVCMPHNRNRTWSAGNLIAFSLYLSTNFLKISFLFLITLIFKL